MIQINHTRSLRVRMALKGESEMTETGAPSPETPAGDGMSMAALAAFPALNFWNAGALTPARAMVASLEAARLYMHAWWSFADASRAMLRQHQDRALDVIESQIAGAPSNADAEHANGPDVFAPMIAASRAYGEIGRSMIKAQRQAFEAMTPTDRPH